MHNDYINYLKGTTVYSNLTTAEKKLKELKTSVDNLLDELDKSGGDTINKMKLDVRNAKGFISSYLNKISSIKSKLEYNAKRFDKVMSNIESKYKSFSESGGTGIAGSGLIAGYRTVYYKYYYDLNSISRDSSNGNIIATFSVQKRAGDGQYGPFISTVERGTAELYFDVLGNQINYIK